MIGGSRQSKAGNAGDGGVTRDNLVLMLSSILCLTGALVILFG